MTTLGAFPRPSVQCGRHLKKDLYFEDDSSGSPRPAPNLNQELPPSKATPASLGRKTDVSGFGLASRNTSGHMHAIHCLFCIFSLLYSFSDMPRIHTFTIDLFCLIQTLTQCGQFINVLLVYIGSQTIFPSANSQETDLLCECRVDIGLLSSDPIRSQNSRVLGVKIMLYPQYYIRYRALY